MEKSETDGFGRLSNSFDVKLTIVADRDAAPNNEKLAMLLVS